MDYLETIRLPTEEDCLTWWRTKRSLLWTRTCCEEAPQHIWYQEVRTPNEADYLKDQIADWGRSLELQYQTMAWDVESTKPSEEGPTVNIWKGRTGRKPHQYKRHWNVESTQYQMALDMSRIWNMLSTAFGCREYTFGKDSGIRKTEKVLQEPDNGKWWFRGIKRHRIWMYKEVYARMITGYSHHRLHALA